jgi:hypothetical protein
MAVVLRLGSLRIIIWPNDHRPAHVHILSNGAEAVFKLNCLSGPPELRETMGFKLHELNTIKQVLVNDLEFLCLKWREAHGAY